MASGVPSVTVPAEYEPLNAPPFGCDGGCSKVVPCTVTEHGVADPAAVQVAASVMPATTTELEVRVRKSAKPDGAGKVV